MLLEKIREGLVGELLNCRHPIFGERIERAPAFIIEGDQLSHVSTIRDEAFRQITPAIPARASSELSVSADHPMLASDRK